MIGTSRANPLRDETDTQRVIRNLAGLGVAGLVAAGGDDTLTVAEQLHGRGCKVIGVPKTMDLDLAGTDYSVGFWAYTEAVFREAVPGFIETLRAHRRVGVLELFGRHSGFTVVAVGIATGACYLAIPELELDLNQLASRVQEHYQRHRWALVAVGEAVNVGAADQRKFDAHGNELLSQRQTGAFLARQIEGMTALDCRSFPATHPFRGRPAAYDALVGFRLGLKAAAMVLAGDWGKMASVQGEDITTQPIAAFKPRRKITEGSWWYELARLRNQGAI